MPKSRKRTQLRDPLANYLGFNIEPNTSIKGDHCPRVFFIIHLFKCSCNTEWSEWESPFSGAGNGECCDNPGCKAAGNPPIMPYKTITKAKTSFQVPHQRVFGSFQCHKCLRRWSTANSWANKAQKCEACLINIYPFAQDDLGRVVRNPLKKHQQDLCEMCEDLKRNCSTLRIKKNRRRARTCHNQNRNQNGLNDSCSIVNAIDQLITKIRSAN